jgi:hypothetical protein
VYEAIRTSSTAIDDIQWLDPPSAAALELRFRASTANP